MLIRTGDAAACEQAEQFAADLLPHSAGKTAAAPGESAAGVAGHRLWRPPGPGRAHRVIVGELMAVADLPLLARAVLNRGVPTCGTDRG